MVVAHGRLPTIVCDVMRMMVVGRSRRHVVFVDHVLVRVAVVWSVAMSWYPAFLRMGITKAWEEKGDGSVLCTSSLLFRSPFLPEA